MTSLRYNRSSVPTIGAFMASNAFVRGICGPFGSGKSSGCVWELVKRGVQQAPGSDGVRRSRWIVVRNTFRQLEDTTIRTVHQWLPPYQFGEWRVNDHSYRLRSFRAADNEPAAEIELLFRALDRPDHVANLLSMELTGGWVNEAREVPWSIIDALQGRVARYPAMRDGGATWSGLIMDTNPPDADSRWYKFFEEEDHRDAIAELAKVVPAVATNGFAAIFKQPSGLSPEAENLPNLPPGYYQRLAIGKSEEWVKVYIRGEYGFVIDGKAVFPEYNDGVHCWDGSDPKRPAPKTVAGLPIYRGWDFGLTPACVFTQILPSGQWIVVDELVATGMGVDRFSDEVITHSGQYFPGCEFVDVGDPAGSIRAETDEKSCFMILHAKGIRIEPGIQTPTIRMEAVRRPLRTLIDGGRPAFIIHPRCKVLRRALMGGYQFRRLQVSAERYSDKIDKNAWSHVAEALCYVGSRLFGPGLVYAGPGEDDGPPWSATVDRTRSSVTGY